MDRNAVTKEEKMVGAEHIDFASNSGEHSLESASLVPYTKKEERALLRRFDKNVMSLVFIIFTLAYLDRSNIGNANVAGMSKDLHLSDKQFQWLITGFYIGYVIFEFSTIAWKIFRPKYWAPFLLICWGAAAMGQGACHTWSQLMACRFLLGTFEAMMTCGMPLYLSFFYYRHELGLRIGILLCSSPLGNAWAGALGYGLTKAKTSLEPWRLLFIVEGAPTIVAAIPLYFLLVDGPINAKFLNTREKEIARYRVERTQGPTTKEADALGVDHKVDIKMYLSAFLDPKNYIVSSMHFAVNVSISSISVFLPIIIKQMGYSSINAQGLSSPPYIAAAISVLCVTTISDRLKTRGVFVSGCAFIGAIGYLLQAVCTGIAPRYFGVYLAACGLFSAAATNITWLLNNQGDQSKRGAALAILQVIGQCGSFVGAQIFPARDKPFYRMGMWVCFSFMMYVSVMSAIYSCILRWDNRRRDREHGPVSNADNLLDITMAGEQHKDWRHMV